ncbi:galactose oxidase-like domain-containing protein [Streptomyces microflavus]
MRRLRHQPRRRVGVHTASPAQRRRLVQTAAHSTDDDQRRVPLTSAPEGTGAYTVSLPADKDVVLPGTYMLFGLGAQGAPSNTRAITVTDPAAG